MLTRGMFHAVTSDELQQLRRTKDGPMRRNLLMEWDEIWPEEWRCSTDKAWKLICVALAFQPGPSGDRPEIGLGLGADMFYGKTLHKANFFVMGHIPREWLPEIVNALKAIDRQKYHDLYFSTEAQAHFAGCCFLQVHGIDASEDRWCQYSWNWLDKIRVLFCNALDGKRSLVFSAENC